MASAKKPAHTDASGLNRYWLSTMEHDGIIRERQFFADTRLQTAEFSSVLLEDAAQEVLYEARRRAKHQGWLHWSEEVREVQQPDRDSIVLEAVLHRCRTGDAVRSLLK